MVIAIIILNSCNSKEKEVIAYFLSDIKHVHKDNVEIEKRFGYVLGKSKRDRYFQIAIKTDDLNKANSRPIYFDSLVRINYFFMTKNLIDSLFKKEEFPSKIYYSNFPDIVIDIINTNGTYLRTDFYTMLKNNEWKFIKTISIMRESN